MMKRKIVLCLLMAVFSVLSVSAQDALGLIRQHYAEAQQMVARYAEWEKEGEMPCPEYYEVNIVQNLPGTGYHRERMRMYYYEHENVGEDYKSDAPMLSRSLHFATAKYNFAAREFYEEFLYDEQGNIEFAYCRNADMDDFLGGELRLYFQGGKLIRALVSIHNPETEKYEQRHAGATVPEQYKSEYESCLYKIEKYKRLFNEINRDTPCKAQEMTKYLFTYFTGNEPEKEQICYAVSDDGFNYTPLNGGMPVVGSDSIAIAKGVRDPHILRCDDGWFRMVVTDMRSSLGWDSNRGIVLMRSRDLIHWEHHTVHFPERYNGTHFAHVTRVWAPQTIYDKEAGKYMVYFSLLTDDGSIPYDRVYWCYANDDFSNLEDEPQVLFDFQAPAIDTDIVQDKEGTYHLFFKTEADGAHKGIRQYVLTDLHHPDTWTLREGFCETTDRDVEGAGVFPLIGGGWCLMYDCYRDGHYQFTKSDDLKTFTFVQNTETKGLFTPRHGTVIQITQDEYERLLSF